QVDVADPRRIHLQGAHRGAQLPAVAEEVRTRRLLARCVRTGQLAACRVATRAPGGVGVVHPQVDGVDREVDRPRVPGRAGRHRFAGAVPTLPDGQVQGGDVVHLLHHA